MVDSTDRIGKRPTREFQCGAEDQTVAHILLKCPLNAETRKQAQRNLNTRNIAVKTLLYKEEGMKEVAIIWGAFEKARWEFEEMDNEDQETEVTEESWGWGELRLNREYELAIRGYEE